MNILLCVEIGLSFMLVHFLERGCSGCKSCSGDSSLRKIVFRWGNDKEHLNRLVCRVLHPLMILIKLVVLCTFPVASEDLQDHPPAYSPLHSRQNPFQLLKPLKTLSPKILKDAMDSSFVMPAPTQQSSLVETRQAVTIVKLDELSRTNQKMNRFFTPVVEAAKSAPNEYERLTALHKAMLDAEEKNIPVTDVDGDRIDLTIIKEILDEAALDPNVGDSVLKPHSETLLLAIKQSQRKHQYASLYANVFKEWLSADDQDNDAGVATPTSDTASEVPVDLGGRPEKITSKQELESIIFAPSSESDPHGTVEYIRSLFSKQGSDKNDTQSKETRDSEETKVSKGKESQYEEDTEFDYLEWEKKWDVKPLEMMQECIRNFGNKTRKSFTMGVTEVKQSIHGLISSELLTDAKRAVCKEILLDEKIITEIARVLTIQLRDIENWSWPDEGVPMVFRRHLNGKYRCYSDEGIMDAIFLQWIGVAWGIEIRERLKNVWESEIWNKKPEPMDKRMEEIRKIMLPLDPSGLAEGSKRKKEQAFEDEFFQSLLPVSLYDFRSYREDGDEQPEENPFPDRRARQEELKQKLLQRMLVDARFSKAVNPDEPFTIAHADIERFAPSLCHDTILEVMRFTGMPEEWIKFLRTFLELPAKFSDGEQPRVSKRGVPISHPLGLIFGEVLLFYLEFAVNKRTGGGVELFRLHDDFWWWSADESKCLAAWETMKEFLSLCGHKWNMSKSGSVKITHNNPLPNSQVPEQLTPGADPLPQGKLSWAFVNLHSDGMFRIDPEQIAKHTQEMKRQLDAQKSVLGFIGAYNRYMHFFNRNFAEPARVFGKGHVEEIIRIFREIHEAIFPEYNGDALQAIKSMVSKRFPGDVPTDEGLLESWLVLPLAYGGLGLRNTTLDLWPVLAQYESEETGPYKQPTFASCIATDKRAYNLCKKEWEAKLSYPSMSHLLSPSQYHEESGSSSHDSSGHNRGRRPKFMTFEEFILGRETKTHAWGQAWESLSGVPEGKYRRAPERIMRALLKFPGSSASLAPFHRAFDSLSRYWKGVLTVYGPQALDAFGRLNYIDQTLLPVAMIEVFNNAKVQWDQ